VLRGDEWPSRLGVQWAVRFALAWLSFAACGRVDFDARSTDASVHDATKQELLKHYTVATGG
jgi:hypothetical protein